MSTPHNQPPGATNLARQDELVTTLNSIMAQLTSISNRLDLQGSTLARHAQLLDRAEGFVALGVTPLSPTVMPNCGPTTGNGQGMGTGVTDGPVPRTHHPPPHDLCDDLRNSSPAEAQFSQVRRRVRSVTVA
jgi:hypothetical protein